MSERSAREKKEDYNVCNGWCFGNCCSSTFICVAGMFEMQVWTRVLLIGIGFVIMVRGISIACVLDREAGAFECPECKERFVSDMKSYVTGPHTITKRKLTCPKCGCTKYCKHVLTR